MAGPQLSIVRSGKWKLHYRDPGRDTMIADPGPRWTDPRGPDGVTLIAQTEQARPDQYPGRAGGPPPKPMMLFDMESDPGEQNDVADSHPDVVARLKAAFENMEKQVPKPSAPAPAGAGRIKRLKGGALRYDLEPTPQP
jgi:hypothetical protein